MSLVGKGGGVLVVVVIFIVIVLEWGRHVFDKITERVRLWCYRLKAMAAENACH
jgi:hypothetical protein